MDVGLPQSRTAADDINDKVGFEQIVLDHGHVQRIGRIAALAIGHFNIGFKGITRDIQLDILQVDRQGIRTDELTVGTEFIPLKLSCGTVRTDKILNRFKPL